MSLSIGYVCFYHACYVLTPKQSNIDNRIFEDAIAFLFFMPVGIPKVVYLMTGDDEESWTDLYHRLYEERLLFLGDEVNSEISNQLNGLLIGLLIFLSLQDKTRDLYLDRNSPDGEVISGIPMFDTSIIPGIFMIVHENTIAEVLLWIRFEHGLGINPSLRRGRIIDIILQFLLDQGRIETVQKDLFVWTVRYKPKNFPVLLPPNRRIPITCMGKSRQKSGGEITKRLAFPHAWRQRFFFCRKKKK